MLEVEELPLDGLGDAVWRSEHMHCFRLRPK